MSLWGLRRIQTCVICCATRPITSSVSVGGYLPADCNTLFYIPISRRMSGATFMLRLIYLPFHSSPFLYHLDLFSLLLSNLSLFMLLTRPPANEYSFLPPLDCHPPVLYLTNPTYSTLSCLTIPSCPLSL